MIVTEICVGDDTAEILNDRNTRRVTTQDGKPVPYDDCWTADEGFTRYYSWNLTPGQTYLIDGKATKEGAALDRIETLKFATTRDVVKVLLEKDRDLYSFFRKADDAGINITVDYCGYDEALDLLGVPSNSPLTDREEEYAQSVDKWPSWHLCRDWLVNEWWENYINNCEPVDSYIDWVLKETEDIRQPDYQAKKAEDDKRWLAGFDEWKAIYDDGGF